MNSDRISSPIFTPKTDTTEFEIKKQPLIAWVTLICSIPPLFSSIDMILIGEHDIVDFPFLMHLLARGIFVCFSGTLLFFGTLLGYITALFAWIHICALECLNLHRLILIISQGSSMPPMDLVLKISGCSLFYLTFGTLVIIKLLPPIIQSLNLMEAALIRRKDH